MPSEVNASSLFNEIKKHLESLSSDEKESQKKKFNTIFQFEVKTKDGVKSWIVDLKNNLTVSDKSDSKADVVITISEEDFVDLATGKLNGQKAFMTGKLKIKGNVMAVTKLEGLFKSIRK